MKLLRNCKQCGKVLSSKSKLKFCSTFCKDKWVAEHVDQFHELKNKCGKFQAMIDYNGGYPGD